MSKAPLALLAFPSARGFFFQICRRTLTVLNKNSEPLGFQLKGTSMLTKRTGTTAKWVLACSAMLAIPVFAHNNSANVRRTDTGATIPGHQAEQALAQSGLAVKLAPNDV